MIHYYLVHEGTIASLKRIHIISDAQHQLCDSTKKVSYALSDAMSSEQIIASTHFTHTKMCQRCVKKISKSHNTNTLEELRRSIESYCEEHFTPLDLSDKLSKMIPEHVKPHEYNEYELKCVESVNKSIIYLISKKEYLQLEPFIYEHKQKFPEYYDGSLTKKERRRVTLINQIGSLENSVASYNIAFKDSGSFVSSDDKIEKYILQDFSTYKSFKLSERKVYLEDLRESMESEGYSKSDIEAQANEYMLHVTSDIQANEKRVQEILEDLHSKERRYDVIYTSYIKPHPYLECNVKLEDTSIKKFNHISINHINILVYEANDLERGNNKRARFFKEGTRVCQNIWYIDKKGEGDV